MKFLLFSDVHLDTPFRWASLETARRRRQALRETVTRICALAEAEDVDALLCGGDLYEHDRFSPDTALFLRDSFASVGCPVFLAPGNHDHYAPESLYRQVDWTPNVRVFDTDRLTPVTLAEGLTLWGAAHLAPANTDGFLDRFSTDRSGVHLALFHGSELSEAAFSGRGKVPHAPFSADQIERSGLHHAFLGHVHMPRDAERYTYPGNPDPLVFGEHGDRGAVIARVSDDGTVRRTRHRVACSVVHDITVDISGSTHSGQVRQRVADAVEQLSGAVRVTLVGDVAPEVDIRPRDLREIGPHLDDLVPRLGAVGVAYDVAAIASEPTVRGQFVRDVSEADLDEDTRRRVLITGLRALDGRIDELEVA